MPEGVGYGKKIAHGGYGIMGVGRKRGQKKKRYGRNTSKAGGSAYSTKRTPGGKTYDPGSAKSGMKYKRS